MTLSSRCALLHPQVGQQAERALEDCGRDQPGGQAMIDLPRGCVNPNWIWI
jgi:hypothetical protein